MNCPQLISKFKHRVLKTMYREKLSYKKAARQFKILYDKRVASWEQIYLAEDPKGLYMERRGRDSKGYP